MGTAGAVSCPNGNGVALRADPSPPGPFPQTARERGDATRRLRARRRLPEGARRRYIIRYPSTRARDRRTSLRLLGAGRSAPRPRPQSAQADFAFSQRRIHSLTQADCTCAGQITIGIRGVHPRLRGVDTSRTFVLSYFRTFRTHALPLPTYTDLDRPAQFLKGVGPKRADLLRKAGAADRAGRALSRPPPVRGRLHRHPDQEPGAGDGLHHRRPRRLQRRAPHPPRAADLPGRRPRLHGAHRVLVARPAVPGPHHRPRRPAAAARHRPLLTTAASSSRASSPSSRAKSEEAAEESGTIFPVYPATEGLTHRQVRTLIAENLDDLLRQAKDEDPLPEGDPRARRRGPAGAGAGVDAPPRLAGGRGAGQAAAGVRGALLPAAPATRRRTTAPPWSARGSPSRGATTLVKPFHKSLPFTLTGAQKRVLKEIGEDMAAPRRMNRLLQGDVGSGKTVVALFAMLRAVENGYQAALMVPTEILAEQHARTAAHSCWTAFPSASRCSPGGCGTQAVERGQLPHRHRRTRTSSSARTRSSRRGVQFHKLGLVVVDEQHRFGVKQRLAIQEMGDNADTLVMSATPIPRSLALTLYGDLDISVLDERPPGRRPDQDGAAVRSRRRPKVLQFVRDEVRQGAAGVHRLPAGGRVGEGGAQGRHRGVRAAAAPSFPDLRLALIHGQMPGEEKDRAMRAFAAGEVDVLVSTTVIEVGIDVPNATVMVIEHAERFGLSQLHQLRGRVGRGSEESYCILRLRRTGIAGAAEGLRLHGGRLRHRRGGPAAARRGRPVRRAAVRPPRLPLRQPGEGPQPPLHRPRRSARHRGARPRARQPPRAARRHRHALRGARAAVPGGVGVRRGTKVRDEATADDRVSPVRAARPTGLRAAVAHDNALTPGLRRLQARPARILSPQRPRHLLTSWG